MNQKLVSIEAWTRETKKTRRLQATSPMMCSGASQDIFQYSWHCAKVCWTYVEKQLSTTILWNICLDLQKDNTNSERFWARQHFQHKCRTVILHLECSTAPKREVKRWDFFFSSFSFFCWSKKLLASHICSVASLPPNARQGLFLSWRLRRIVIPGIRQISESIWELQHNSR